MWPKNVFQGSDLTAERLREVLDYDPEAGHLTWKTTKSSRSSVGSVAGSMNESGYWLIRVDGRHYRAHRLAWLHVHGRWPDRLIDHINGERADNRLANLRDVSRSVNAQNQRGVRKDCAVGIKGVAAHHRRFVAQIFIDGKHTHLGVFKTAQEAGEAYLAAKRAHHDGCTI